MVSILARLGARRRLQLALAVVAALTLLLGVLFLRTQALDLDAQDRIFLQLRELEKLDAEWDAAIVRAHSGLPAPRQPLDAAVPRMHVLMASLGAAANGAGAPARAAHASLGAALRAKEQLVGRFALHNPALRAALLYVPPAVADLKTEAGGIEGALAPGQAVLRLDGALNTLLSQLLRFNLTPSPALAERIEATLGNIEAQRRAFPPPLALRIDRLVRESRVILANRPQENALEAEIAATDTAVLMDALGQRFADAFDAALRERQRFRGYLSAYSVALLAMLAFLVARLRRSYRIIGEVNARLQAANQHLEQRVAERTAALEAQSRQLEQLARHDSLTGLVNARELNRQIDLALRRAARHGRVVALLFFDLDGFKAVNDQWGHAVGDLVLRQVAERVQAVLRADDTLARLGGDEFVVLLGETGAREGALRVAGAVLAAVESITEAGGHRVAISASIGITAAAGAAGQARGAQALLDEADHAMYQAKQEGKGRHAISPAACWAAAQH